MIRKMTAHKGLAFATLALVLGAATVVLGLAFAGPANPGLPEPLPAMTLEYEVYGASVSVGHPIHRALQGDQAARIPLADRLDGDRHRVPDPRPRHLRHGHLPGLVHTLNGNTMTEYDALTDTTDTRSVGAGIHLPFDALGHAYTPAGTAPIVGMDAGVSVALDARVVRERHAHTERARRQVHEGRTAKS